MLLSLFLAIGLFWSLLINFIYKRSIIELEEKVSCYYTQADKYQDSYWKEQKDHCITRELLEDKNRRLKNLVKEYEQRLNEMRL